MDFIIAFWAYKKTKKKSQEKEEWISMCVSAGATVEYTIHLPLKPLIYVGWLRAFSCRLRSVWKQKPFNIRLGIGGTYYSNSITKQRGLLSQVLRERNGNYLCQWERLDFESYIRIRASYVILLVNMCTNIFCAGARYPIRSMQRDKNNTVLFFVPISIFS